MSITIDKDKTTVLKTKNQHTCESSQSDKKTEAHVLRIRSRNKSGDITKRPSQIIRTELQTMDEQTLQSADLKNLAKAVYRERRKKLPTLPKNRKDVHDVVDEVNTKTNKDESLLLINDRDAEIIIFSTYLNMECLCNSMSELFIDGTFMCCPRYFYQLYTIHGCKNGNYVPLLYCLLPSKSEACYTKMWSLLLDYCQNKGLHLQPNIIHVDFEKAMHNSVKNLFPETQLDCCRFHLGQCWWRKIQSVGLSSEYKDKSSEIGKWLTRFFGLPFLAPDEVEDCFTDDIMSDAPDAEACMKFSDYILEEFVTPTSTFPPSLWSSPPENNAKRTNNGTESFHSHYNGQFYARHPNIFFFLDVIRNIQSTTYVKLRSLDTQALVRRSEADKVKFSTDQFEKYITGTVSRASYVCSMGYKFAARTDL